jgi:hypothetical protein
MKTLVCIDKIMHRTGARGAGNGGASIAQCPVLGAVQYLGSAANIHWARDAPTVGNRRPRRPVADVERDRQLQGRQP